MNYSSLKKILKFFLSRFDNRFYGRIGNFFRGSFLAVYTGLVVLMIVAIICIGLYTPYVFNSTDSNVSTVSTDSTDSTDDTDGTIISDVTPPLDEIPVSDGSADTSPDVVLTPETESESESKW